MSTIVVAKDDDGKLIGLTEKDDRAWRRFRAMIRKLECGEFFTIDYWFPRDPKLHRLHFKIIGTVFDAQEQFPDSEDLRGWLYVGAGHCTFAPGPKGRMVAIPKSIKWSKVDDAEFQAIHDRVIDFMRSEHARRFLWPHLSAEATWEAIETLLAQSMSGIVTPGSRH